MKSHIIPNQRLDYKSFFDKHLELNNSEDSKRINCAIEEYIHKTNSQQHANINDKLHMFNRMFGKNVSQSLFGDNPKEADLTKAVKVFDEYTHQKLVQLKKTNKALIDIAKKGSVNI